MARYRSIVALQRDLASCRRCVEAGYRLDSWPVVHGRAGQRAYLLGQAPGLVEGTEGRPWRGRAGQTLRRWLGLGDEEFYATFHCASITRCYPGRPSSGRGDRTPSPAERALCAGWRDEELRLLRPALVVTVGGLAARGVLGVASLTDCVGDTYVAHGAVVVPLPHPSGASGWLNDSQNRARLRDALAHVSRELRGLASPRQRPSAAAGAARGRRTGAAEVP